MTKRSLEIDEDISFQRREWFWQRIGIALLSLLVLGALVGLTGAGGPLSHGEAGDREGAVHVEYERIVRRGAGATLTLHLRGSSLGPTQFWVSAPYFEHITVEDVAPLPDAVSVEPTREVFTVRSGAPAVTVILHVRHTTIGWIEAEVGLVDGPSARFRQLSLF